MKRTPLLVVTAALTMSCDQPASEATYSDEMAEEAAEEIGGPTQHFEPTEPPIGGPDSDMEGGIE